MLSIRGAPREALLQVAESGVLLASGDTAEEFVTRLRRPKFDPYLDPGDREEYIAWVLARAERVGSHSESSPPATRTTTSSWSLRSVAGPT